MYIFIVISILISNVYCSLGDQSQPYWNCTQSCRNNLNCPQSFNEFGWTREPCFSCKYDCMWTAVTFFENSFGKVPQFHGKWPFLALRVSNLVIQEPASVIFSLLNLFTVYLFYIRLGVYTNLPDKEVWSRYCLVGMFTWCSSTLFHCIDFWGTEYLDYFGAFAFVLAGFYVSLIFTMPEVFEKWKRLKSVLPIILVCGWIFHVNSMIDFFDYSYNMKLCIVVSVVSTLLYVRFLVKRYRREGRLSPADRLLIRSLLLLNGSVLLEQLDFVPFLWSIDAHSLFHLATVPCPLWFSRCLKMYTQEKIYTKYV